MMVVFSLNIGPEVIRKLASLPASMLPTLSYTFNNVAGVLVNASSALFSDNPASIDLRRFAMNIFGSRNSAAVRQKGIFAFSKAAGLEGAISQCFISVSVTYLASLGSSTSIGCGKFKERIYVAFVPAISFIRWYSLPPPLMIY